MYTFSSKLKNLSFILMLLGALGIGYGFFTAPKNTQDVEAILASGHGEHHEASANEVAHESKPTSKEEVSAKETVKDSTATAANHLDSIANKVEDNHVAADATPIAGSRPITERSERVIATG